VELWQEHAEPSCGVVAYSHVHVGSTTVERLRMLYAMLGHLRWWGTLVKQGAEWRNHLQCLRIMMILRWFFFLSVGSIIRQSRGLLEVFFWFIKLVSRCTRWFKQNPDLTFPQKKNPDSFFFFDVKKNPDSAARYAPCPSPTNCFRYRRAEP